MIQNIIFILFPLFSGWMPDQNNTDGFTLKGKINGNYSDYIFLNYGEVKDSVRVENSTFEFKGAVEKPILATLNLRPSASVAGVYLENSTISVNADFKIEVYNNKPLNVLTITNVSGSYSADLHNRYQNFARANNSKVNYEQLLVQELKSIFTENPRHTVCGRILSGITLNQRLSYDDIYQLFQLIDTTAQHTGDLKIIKTGLRVMNAYSVGQQFVSFTLPGSNSTSISVKNYSGKIVMVDFWASWCGPCREKHPKMVQLLKKYNNKNFEIISVSVDTDKSKWLKAIEKDGLYWSNAWDHERKIERELGIVAIPYNYLIDEQGKILEVNPSLEKIEQIIQSKK